MNKIDEKMRSFLAKNLEKSVEMLLYSYRVGLKNSRLILCTFINTMKK